MRNIKKIIAIFLIVLTGCMVSSYAKSGTVKTAVRLRADKSTSSNIITTMYYGDVVEILNEEDENWYQVSYNNQKGYVMKEYIENGITTATVNNTEKKNETSEVINETKNEIKNEMKTEDTGNNTGTVETVEVKTTDEIELRIGPSVVYIPNEKIKKSDSYEVVLELGNWVKITSGDVSGWILKTKLNTTEEKPVEEKPAVETSKSEEKATSIQGIVLVETARVRSGPSKDAEVIGSLNIDEKVTVEAEEGDWYKITTSEISGYVSNKLISTKNSSVSSRSLTEAREENVESNEAIKEDKEAISTDISKEKNEEVVTTGNSNVGSQVASLAKQYLGYSYVAAGKSPETGFDCSGFTYYIYSQFGYSIGASSSGQASVGTEVARENMQPGDLLVFLNEGKTAVGHVGIYIGNNIFVHSANPTRGVVEENLATSSYYNERYVSARRIVN